MRLTCLPVLALTGCVEQFTTLGPAPPVNQPAPPAPPPPPPLEPPLVETTPPFDDAAAPGPPPPAGIGTESSWCWTLQERDDELALLVIGMDTETVVEVARSENLYGQVFGGDGLVYADDAFHTMLGGRWVRIGYPDGTFEVGSIIFEPGPWPSVWNGRIAVLSDNQNTVTIYEDQAALDTNAGFLHYLTAAPAAQFSRFHLPRSDWFLGAWHASDHLSIHDATDGRLIGDLPLEGFDDWIADLDTAGDLIHVLSYPPGASSIPQIGRWTRSGTYVDRVAVPELPTSFTTFGLWCDSPDP